MKAKDARDVPIGRWVSCRRCDADEAVPVLHSGDRLLGIPGRFQVVRCCVCGFLYTNPQPDDGVLARHYPDTYWSARPVPGAAAPTRGGLRARLRAGVLTARGYPRAPRPGWPWRAAGWLASRVLAQRFLWLPPFVPGGTLLDVGSGSGAYLAEMRDLGWRTIGVEPSPSAAEAARAELGLDVRIGTLEEAAIPDASVDVVVMRMVLEHVRDPRRTLAVVRRVLRPGGSLILSVPNAGSLEARLLGTNWFAWDLPRHLSHFTPGSLAAMLREVGFERVRIRHLLNANNLAQSLGYRRGAVGPPGDPAPFLWLLAAVAAAARTAGRIAAEARRPDTRTMTCALCGPGAEGAGVFRGRDLLVGVPGEFEVVRCVRCGLLATWPHPLMGEDFARLYPQTYPTYTRGPDVGRPARLTARWRASLREAFLAGRGYPPSQPTGWLSRCLVRLLRRPLAVRFRRFPPYTPGGVVLDVGCGQGFELAELRQRGWHAIGVEPDPISARHAREELGLEVRTGTLEGAGLKDASVDVVILRHVLEHLPDPLTTLGEIRRVLRPGGRLYVEIPNAASWEARLFGSRWRGWELPRHLHHFTPRTVRALLERSGFVSIAITHVPSTRTIVASLGMAAQRPGPLWGSIRKLLSRAHTPLSLAATLPALVQSAARRSGLIWVEARREDGLR